MATGATVTPLPTATRVDPAANAARINELNRINYIIIGCVLIAILVAIIFVILYRMRRRFICCKVSIPKSETAQTIIGLNDHDQMSDDTKVKAYVNMNANSNSHKSQTSPSPRVKTHISVINLESNLHPPKKWFRSSELRFIDEEEDVTEDDLPFVTAQ